VFLQGIRPAQVEVALAMAADLERERALVERQWGLRLERARYDAERAFRQYALCEPETRLVARELEGRWNQQLRLLADLEAEYRREQERGLAPLTDDERAARGRLVGDVPALWAAAETTMADRKRLVRCLLREGVRLRDDQPRARGGVTLIRIGWCSGAWTELRAHRPSSGETACTPAPVLARIRLLAHLPADDRVAALLNAAGLRTRMGLPWTYPRVGLVRHRHGIPTACPIVPNTAGPRGAGRVSVATVAAQLGVARSVVGRWCRCGFLDAEQQPTLDPRWIRLPADDLARVAGTLAAQGYGRWRLREAQRALDLSEAALYQQLPDGELLAYRARIGDHWEWRVSCADDQPLPSTPRPGRVHAESKDVQ